MRAFVTGATGLLGGNLVRLLAREGHEVKALVRSRGKGERHLGDLLSPSGGVDLVEGDMLDVAAFAPELEGSLRSRAVLPKLVAKRSLFCRESGVRARKATIRCT